MDAKSLRDWRLRMDPKVIELIDAVMDLLIGLQTSRLMKDLYPIIDRVRKIIQELEDK